jgi:pyruvate formate lyase activating enzyme
MLFGGIQKNSLIDYPGKFSCVLFLSGCNFSCPFCHNPNLALGHPASPPLDPEDIYGFLRDRREFLDGVVISGGEPTLQRDLSTLCRTIKEMGFPIKLDTNGSRPEVLERLFDENLVDYVAMDIKTDPVGYAPVIRKEGDPVRLLSSIRTIMDRAPAYEFRTTCVKPLVDAAIIERIARQIEGASLYALQHFESSTLLCPEFFENRDPSFTDDELHQFRRIAAPFVKQCIIR